MLEVLSRQWKMLEVLSRLKMLELLDMKLWMKERKLRRKEELSRKLKEDRNKPQVCC